MISEKRIWKDIITGLRNWHKIVVGILGDAVVLIICLFLSYSIRMGLDNPRFDFWGTHLYTFGLALVICLPIFFSCGLYRESIRYVRMDFIWKVAQAVTVGIALWLLALHFLRIEEIMPRTVPVLFGLLLVISMVGTRDAMRYWLLSGKHLNGTNTPNDGGGIAVAIYGGGAAGHQLMSALDLGSEYRVTALMDKDAAMHGRIVAGRMVYSPDQTDKMVDREGVKEILIALPSVSRSVRRRVITNLEQYGLPLRSVPDLEDLVTGRAKIQDLREIEISEVLERAEVAPQQNLMGKCISGYSVMVTGAGGSIGSEICRQIISLKPKTLIVYDQSEFNLYAINAELQGLLSEASDRIEVIAVLGSVLDARRLLEVMRSYAVKTVYHAAAYKHVPLIEHNIAPGIRNNVLGTLFTAQAAIVSGVERFVLISTDKAVRPTNVMGASKRLAELCLQALSETRDVALMWPEQFGLPNQRVLNQTCFTMVRFGNVLDSSGSVIPLFRKQINQGAAITVTHPDIVRYFMTIREAANLVIQAGALGVGGEVFLLDMGRPVKVADLGRRMINLYGLTVRDSANPDGDIEILYTGLRAGEKLYEEMLIDEGAEPTGHPRIFMGNEPSLPWGHVVQVATDVLKALDLHDFAHVKALLQTCVSGYAPSSESVDWLDNDVARVKRGGRAQSPISI